MKKIIAITPIGDIFGDWDIEIEIRATDMTIENLITDDILKALEKRNIKVRGNNPLKSQS